MSLVVGGFKFEQYFYLIILNNAITIWLKIKMGWDFPSINWIDRLKIRKEHGSDRCSFMVDLNRNCISSISQFFKSKNKNAIKPYNNFDFKNIDSVLIGSILIIKLQIMKWEKYYKLNKLNEN